MARRDDRVILSQPRNGYGRPASGYPYSSSDDSRRGTTNGTPVELAQIMAKRVDRHEDDFVPGLSELEKTDAVVVQQQMAIDLKAGCGSGNTYQIKTKEGTKLFFVVEEDNCCCRWICGPHRMFHLTVLDKQDSPVLYLDREACRCDWWCCVDCCCCQHKLLVRNSVGEPIGSVREKFHIFNFKGEVMDKDGNIMNKISGPCCACRCCSEMNFDIFDKNGEREEGFYFKKWMGAQEWVNVDHENFEIQFPESATAIQKALLIGAGFLVDFMYFEMS